jgi:hypothetical protein
MMYLFSFFISLLASPPIHTSDIYEQIREVRIDTPLFRDIRRIEVFNEEKFALFDFASHSIVVIDTTGKPIATLGRQGSGPGEFRRISDFTVIGDVVYVYDQSNLKISAFRSDGHFITEFRVNKKAFHMTSDGRSLFLYYTMDIHVSEPLIYQLDRQSGRLFSEFGNPSPLLLEMRTGTTGIYRSIAASRTSICATHPYEYAINCYDEDGNSPRIISGKAAEFKKPRPEHFYRESRIQAITHITTGLFSHADTLYLLYRNQENDNNFMDIYNLSGTLSYGALIDDLQLRHIDSKTGIALSVETISTPNEDYTSLKLYKRVVPK